MLSAAILEWFTLISRKIKIATSGWEPKWQRLLAEDALAELYLVQKNLVTWSRRISKSSRRSVNPENHPIRCRGTRSCHWMDSMLSVLNQILTWDGKKFVKIIGSVAHTDSCTHKQFDGIWESMWRFIMESPHFNTASIRDKWHSWKTCSMSKRRYVNWSEFGKDIVT